MMERKKSISHTLFSRSMDNFDSNYFVQFLRARVGSMSGLCGKFCLGTSYTLDGSTIFWQKDFNGVIQGAKIFLYDPGTGSKLKRIPLASLSFTDAAFSNPQFDAQNCFFLEHLLSYDGKPVVIVESEKEAVIQNIVNTKHVWIAAGDLNAPEIKKRFKVIRRRFSGKQFYYSAEETNLVQWQSLAAEFTFLKQLAP